jgi:hypothetical protein
VNLLAKAIGIGRAEPDAPLQPRHRQLIRSAHLSPWSTRFRFGWVLGWNGPYWHNGAGVMGPDFNNGNWLGGGSWHRRIGPVALCRWRRRGSLRSDMQFERNMGCSCQHLSWRWARGHGQVIHRVLCARVEEETMRKELRGITTREIQALREDVANCTCIHTCAEDPATACSLSGRWHVHPDEPCPAHPDAPGDR